MSFPARERQERTARNGFESIEFAICTPKGWWKKKRKNERERTRGQARKLERKLTIPSLFFFNVNFIATSRLFTGRSVCTPDSECRLFWLPESWRRTRYRRLRYDEIRDDEDKVSVIDYCALFSLAHLSFASCFLSFSSFYIISLFTFSHAVSRIFLATHPLSFLFPIHWVSTQTRDPTISLLRFSHFNVTFVFSFATIPIIHPYDIVDNGNDGCAFLFMPPFSLSVSFVRITFFYLLSFDQIFTSSFSVSFVLSKRPKWQSRRILYPTFLEIYNSVPNYHISDAQNQILKIWKYTSRENKES